MRELTAPDGGGHAAHGPRGRAPSPPTTPASKGPGLDGGAQGGGAAAACLRLAGFGTDEGGEVEESWSHWWRLFRSWQRGRKPQEQVPGPKPAVGDRGVADDVRGRATSACLQLAGFGTDEGSEGEGGWSHRWQRLRSWQHSRKLQKEGPQQPAAGEGGTVGAKPSFSGWLQPRPRAGRAPAGHGSRSGEGKRQRRRRRRQERGGSSEQEEDEWFEDAEGDDKELEEDEADEGGGDVEAGAAADQRQTSGQAPPSPPPPPAADPAVPGGTVAPARGPWSWLGWLGEMRSAPASWLGGAAAPADIEAGGGGEIRPRAASLRASSFDGSFHSGLEDDDAAALMALMAGPDWWSTVRPPPWRAVGVHGGGGTPPPSDACRASHVTTCLAANTQWLHSPSPPSLLARRTALRPARRAGVSSGSSGTPKERRCAARASF
jgi:hypothetical protein